MTIPEAYNELFRLSSGNDWVKIPEDIRRVLNLDSRLGIYGGILCTKNSAIGISQLINRLNKIGEK